MVRLQACPGEAVQRYSMTAKGMAQAVVRPLRLQSQLIGSWYDAGSGRAVLCGRLDSASPQLIQTDRLCFVNDDIIGY
jgi:hypothetical protein